MRHNKRKKNTASSEDGDVTPASPPRFSHSSPLSFGETTEKTSIFEKLNTQKDWKKMAKRSDSSRKKPRKNPTKMRADPISDRVTAPLKSNDVWALPNLLVPSLQSHPWVRFYHITDGSWVFPAHFSKNPSKYDAFKIPIESLINGLLLNPPFLDGMSLLSTF